MIFFRPWRRGERLGTVQGIGCETGVANVFDGSEEHFPGRIGLRYRGLKAIESFIDLILDLLDSGQVLGGFR